MPEKEPDKFGIRDVVELLGLGFVGVGTGLLWGIGAALAIVGAIVLAVCLLPKMIQAARDGAERRAD